MRENEKHEPMHSGVSITLPSKPALYLLVTEKLMSYWIESKFSFETLVVKTSSMKLSPGHSLENAENRNS